MLCEDLGVFLKVEGRFSFGDDKTFPETITFDHGMSALITRSLVLPRALFFLPTADHTCLSHDFLLINQAFLIIGANLATDRFIPLH